MLPHGESFSTRTVWVWYHTSQKPRSMHSTPSILRGKKSCLLAWRRKISSPKFGDPTDWHSELMWQRDHIKLNIEMLAEMTLLRGIMRK